jgi:capsular polysaccharide transport system permease protein
MASRVDGGRGLFFDREEWSDLVGSFIVWCRVIYAIVLRESRTRYGSSDLGYVWALVDPLIQLTVLLLIFEAVGRTSPIPVPLPVFLMTGIIPFHFFKDCVSRGAKAGPANLALLTYPQVKVADVVIGRVILEAVTAVAVYFMFVVALRVTMDIPLNSWVGELDEQAASLAAIFYFGLAFGLFSSSLARLTPLWDSIWSYMARPLWLLSGVFYSLSAIPSHGGRHFMAYNPLAHLLEWWRSASIPYWDSAFYSPAFVLTCATGVLVIGLLTDRVLALIGHSEAAQS